MTELDEKIIPKVNKAIDRVGVDCIFHYFGPGVQSDDGLSIVRPELTEELKSSPALGFTSKDIDGEKVQIDDLYILVKGQFKPTTEMHAEIHGERYSIPSVTPYYSGDLVAAYNVQLRKGSS